MEELNTRRLHFDFRPGDVIDAFIDCWHDTPKGKASKTPNPASYGMAISVNGQLYHIKWAYGFASFAEAMIAFAVERLLRIIPEGIHFRVHAIAQFGSYVVSPTSWARWKSDSRWRSFNAIIAELDAGRWSFVPLDKKQSSMGLHLAKDQSRKEGKAAARAYLQNCPSAALAGNDPQIVRECGG